MRSPTRTLLALLTLAAACNASDHLIVTEDAGTGAPDTGNAPAPDSAVAPAPDGAFGSGSDSSFGPAPDSAVAPAPDAAVIPDLASSPEDLTFGGPVTDAPSTSDLASSGEVGSSLSCAQLPACAQGTQCLCCPLGFGTSHCTCSIPCTSDAQCSGATPHCNVRKLQGIPIGEGFCTDPGFPCLW